MYFKARSQRRLLSITLCTLIFVLGYLYFHSSPQEVQEFSRGQYDPNLKYTKPNYVPGVPKAVGDVYSRTLVIARTRDEDVNWTSTEIPLSKNSLTVAAYTVDDPETRLAVPVNKGHESMTYLTYIIDHYDRLSDVTLFMHSHQFAWHNNDLLNADAANTIWRLNLEKVMREGYMNLRCHLKPGCGPAMLHPSKPSWDPAFPEEPIIGAAWIELFGPAVPVPDTLAQPCCGQFAVSRERLRALSKEQYLHFRRWLTQTQYADNISGRVFEYIWQFLFTGIAETCPPESVCYCDGFGLCFGGEKPYRDYLAKKEELTKLQEIVHNAERDQAAHSADSNYHGGDMAAAKDRLIDKVKRVKVELDKTFAEALRKGDDPVQRAAELEKSEGG